jgi:hypothetical protein
MMLGLLFPFLVSDSDNGGTAVALDWEAGAFGSPPAHSQTQADPRPFVSLPQGFGEWRCLGTSQLLHQTVGRYLQCYVQVKTGKSGWNDTLQVHSLDNIALFVIHPTIHHLSFHASLLYSRRLQYTSAIPLPQSLRLHADHIIDKDRHSLPPSHCYDRSSAPSSVRTVPVSRSKPGMLNWVIT